jgi:methyl-accepting chemotaxis protein
MVYLLIAFGMVILIEGFIIYKLINKNNKRLTGQADIDISKEMVLSDKYLELIGRFSFSVEEIYMEMKEISYKVENVMSESEEQAASMISISDVIEDIYSNVETNLANSETSSEISKKSHKEIYTKITQLKENIDELSGVRRLLDNTSTSIADLETKTLNAESLISRINNISEQTNLLALNASIEAARAGEYGKGFSVIADEIRVLAAETNEVTNVISEIIKELRNSFVDTKDELIDVLDKIEGQTISIDKTIVSFQNIEQISKELYSKTSDISFNSKKIVEQIYNLKEFINSITHSVEEVTKSIVDVNQSVLLETKSVDNLNSSISRFEEVNFEFLQLVKDNYPVNRITIATIPYEPFIIYDAEKDIVSGMDIDMINKIYLEAGYQVEYKMVPWETSIIMAKKGLVDILPTIEINEEREKFLDFSINYRNESKYNFYTNKENNISINDIDDLKGKQVGVLTGYNYYTEFDQNTSFDRDYSFKEDIMFQKLLKGQIDVVVLNSYSGNYLIKKLKLIDKVKEENYKYAQPDTTESRIGFVKAKNNKHLIDLFNKRFIELEKEGTIKEITDKYLA